MAKTRHEAGVRKQVMEYYESHPEVVPTYQEVAAAIHRPPLYVRTVIRWLVEEGFLKRRIVFIKDTQ